MLVCTLALVQWVNLAVLGQLVVFVGQVHNDCTPLPAALPLFAIGLGAMVYLAGAGSGKEVVPPR